MTERYIYNERNISQLIKYYLAGKIALAEELRMASIQYYEGGELEEPKTEELAA